MNYSWMSDFEINKLVAEALGEEVTGNHHSSVICKDKDNPDTGWLRDYCNSWADMGPLINEYGIGVWTHPDFDGKWSARFNIKRGVSVVYDVTQDKNPLRAAAICFLMMKESEDE